MKLIVMIIMFSSILFGWQKQIIVGSYSVENNGKRALRTINKQIESDIQLQAFMKEYSLRAINTEISNYTVVSVNAFESYTALLNTMKVLKVYYEDAYVLKYPTQNIRDAENLEDIEAKAAVEQEIEDTEDELKRAELKRLLEEEALEAELMETYAQKSVEVEKTQEPVEEITPVVEEAKEDIYQEKESLENSINEKSKKDSEKIEEEVSNTQEYLMYIVALAIIALLAAGITVYKIAGNTKGKKQDDNA